jgi:sugar lactone lactonase YvrE
VGRIALDGTVTWQYVAPFVNPITFSDDGRLFVGQAFFGETLYELDPDLVDPPVLIWHGSGMPGWPEQLNGFDFGPDGKLYAPQPFMGRIVRIDVDTAVLDVVASGLDEPIAVKFDAMGRLYAVVQGAGDVVRVDVVTGETSTYVHLVEGLDNCAFDARGRLYVTHSNNGSVWRILPSGVARRMVRGGLMAPGGIAAVPGPCGHDWLYVADFWEMKAYDGLSGRYAGVTRQRFVGPSIIGPFTAAPCGDDLVLTSFYTNEVQLWDPATSSEVALWSDFAVPMNAIEFGDGLAVAELGSSGVAWLRGDGSRTHLAGPLYIPMGLAAKGGDLWAADWATGVVWQLVDEGVPLAAALPVAGGLAGPEGLAIDAEGCLLVVESLAGRVARIDPATGAKSVVAEGLTLGMAASPSMPPTWVFNGIAVGARGDIYVTADIRNRIYRIRAVPLE